MRDPNGVIHSPGYPAPANGSVTCDWTVLVPVGYRIRVTLNDLSIPSDSDTCRHAFVVVSFE